MMQLIYLKKDQFLPTMKMYVQLELAWLTPTSKMQKYSNVILLIKFFVFKVGFWALQSFTQSFIDSACKLFLILLDSKTH